MTKKTIDTFILRAGPDKLGRVVKSSQQMAWTEEKAINKAAAFVYFLFLIYSNTRTKAIKPAFCLSQIFRLKKYITLIIELFI